MKTYEYIIDLFAQVSKSEGKTDREIWNDFLSSFSLFLENDNHWKFSLDSKHQRDDELIVTWYKADDYCEDRKFGYDQFISALAYFFACKLHDSFGWMYSNFKKSLQGKIHCIGDYFEEESFKVEISHNY